MKKIIKRTALGIVTASLLASTSLFADFYVMVNNQKKGPMSVEEITQLVQDGQVNKDSYVWQEGMQNWAKAGEQSELASLFSAPPPPPAQGVTPPPPPLSAPATPAASASGEDINAMADAKAVPQPSASDSVEDWADSVLEKFGISSFGENNGKYFVFAQQSVSLKPTDPQYGDAVVNAFDKAMMKVQERYVMDLFGKISTEKIHKMFSDRSTNAKQIDLPPAASPTFWNKLMFVLDKKLDVETKKLDQELISMGVDPNELKTMPKTIKKDLFRDTFIKKTLQQASGEISGLVPVQTTLVRDANGNTVIGVVAVASQKTKQIAKDIALQRKSLVKGRGRDLATLLPRSPREFLSTMGVRLAYDKDGSPAIISYGMASYRPDSGDDYINDELRSEAVANASANADAQIAEMVNGYMSAKTERKNGEETRKYVEREVKIGSDTLEKTVKNIIKTVNKNVKSSAKMRVQGISTLKRWRYTSKEGVKFVGVVRVWKYSTLNAINQFKNPQKSKASVKKKVHRTFQQESRVINSMDDF